MDGLTYQLQRYVVKQLACDVPPETVAETLRKKFLTDVNSDVIAQYDPSAEGNR